MKFAKYHSCGNSCLLCFQTEYRKPSEAFVRQILHADFGVGADNLLIAFPDSSSPTSFGLDGFNPDGSFVGMCGNGVRCMTAFLQYQGLLPAGCQQVSYLLRGRPVSARFLENVERIEVNFGKPAFDWEAIPLASDSHLSADGILRVVLDDGQIIEGIAVQVGNPHFVVPLVTSELSTEAAYALGSVLEVHPMFPQRTNVEFVRYRARDHIELFFWERRVGITQASGSGTAAAVSGSIRLGLCQEQVRCTVPGGEFYCRLSSTSEVFVAGSTARICEGVLHDSVWKNY